MVRRDVVVAVGYIVLFAVAFVMVAGLVVVGIMEEEVQADGVGVARAEGAGVELVGVVRSSGACGVPRVLVEGSSDALVPVGGEVLVWFADGERKGVGLTRGDRVELRCQLLYWDGWEVGECWMMSPVVR